MAVPTNRESDKFMLRLPDGMRDRIRTSAEANNRSMNAEIVAALEEKYPAPVEEIGDLSWLLLLLGAAPQETHDQMLAGMKVELVDSSLKPEDIEHIHNISRKIADEFVAKIRARGGLTDDELQAIKKSVPRGVTVNRR